MQAIRACQTCRARRIKCDGARPVCQKCVKSRRACVEADVAKQQLFAIHNENQYATGEIRRPRGPRSSLVPMQPNFDLKTRANAYYVQNHFQIFQDMPDVATTWNDCFHQWRADGKSSPVVDLAFSSLALSVFARTQDCRPAAIEASKSYLRLLQHMQSRILHIKRGNLNADEVDVYLLSAYFMARYESFVQTHSNAADSAPLESMKVWFHFDGAGAILKIWYDNRTRYTPTATVKQTRRLLIKSSLLRERPLPRWLVDGDQFGESDVALDFDRFLIQIIDIHQILLKLEQECKDKQSVAAEAEDLIGKSSNLDKDIQHWSTGLPGKWSYSKHSLPGTRDYPRDDFYSPAILSCAKPGYTAVWNEYYGTRMLISHTRLRILDLPVASQPMTACEAERLECSAQLHSSADSLASFVPFSLDRVRLRPHPTSAASVEVTDEPFKPYLANLVVWPMAIASSLHKLEQKRKQWFRSGISRISGASSECLIAYTLSDYWIAL